MSPPATPIIATVTPFDARGAIDWGAYRDYLQALAAWGVGTIISNGSTGEFPSLTLSERQRVCEFARQHFPGCVLNQIGSTCIADARALLRGSLEHADGILVLPPYYYAGADRAGLCAFFAAVLRDCPLPTYLYHFPKHTCNDIDIELIQALGREGIALAGIKDSSGDLGHALRYAEAIPGFEVYLANDGEVLGALRAGLRGSVSGAANALPEALLRIAGCHLRGDGRALDYQAILDRWNRFRSTAGVAEIPLIKASLAARLPGFPLRVRPPFRPVGAPLVAAVAEAIAAARADLTRLDGESGTDLAQLDSSTLPPRTRVAEKRGSPIGP